MHGLTSYDYERHKMWGLREQIKELRAELQKIADYAQEVYVVRPQSEYEGHLRAIRSMAQKALDKR